MSTPRVYRAPMRSRRAGVTDGAANERALRLGVCGLAGTLTPAPRSPGEVVAAAALQHDERLARRIERFGAAPDGSLVWTRDIDGLYWLGRLGGSLRYDGTGEAIEVDLVHVRDCDWMPAPVPDTVVPSAVLATFARGGRNWQEIHAAGVGEASASIWSTSGR